MIWIALAAHLTAAQPLKPGIWFANLEWENLVARKGGHALNFVRVIAAPDGRPQDCTIEVTSGIPELDKETCALILKHGRFKPARWADGTPTYGVYRKDFLWAESDNFQYSRPVDVEIALSRLPESIRSPVSYTLKFAVSSAGTKSSCDPPERMDATLASIACKQVMENYPVTAAHNSAGVAVASVQTAIVSFVSQ